MRDLLRVIISVAVVITIMCTIYTSSTGQATQSNKNLNQNKTNEQTETIDEDLTSSSKFDINGTVQRTNLYSNPEFTFFDNESGLVSFGLPSFWNEQFKSCNASFVCSANFSTGWKDNTSFQLSTTNGTRNAWSITYGQEIDVKSIDRYEIITHMKVNKWATQSHAKLEGFNETSNKWYQIKQCPSGVNGPIDWEEFRCVITIPPSTTKIRPVLIAGWSSEPGREATTWFDSIYMIKSSVFIADPDLKADVFYNGLSVPTNMAFLGPNDILVLEKDKGTVQRIVNGTKLRGPLLDLEVARHDGLTGIAIEKNLTAGKTDVNKQSTYIFLYFTASERDSEDLVGKKPLGNYVYRYQFVNNTLVNPKLLLDLPAGSEHNGGEILIGPDRYLYILVGEVYTKNPVRNTPLNHEEGGDPDGRAGILRIDQDGKATDIHGILGDKIPLNMYYAYGIRNSFGMDFDPLTGNLWDTENGPDFGDEINLVKPGFNSGWDKVHGMWTVPDRSRASEDPNNLVNFNGKGKYSSPEFTWNHTVGPTALKFLSTSKLGKQYENDMLVADVNNGRIYHFKLSQNRTALVFQGPLIDKIADTDDELSSVVFAQGFGMITDLQIGPDGYLYVLSLDQGKIFRIVPGNMNEDTTGYIDQLSNDGLLLIGNIVMNSSNLSH